MCISIKMTALETKSTTNETFLCVNQTLLILFHYVFRAFLNLQLLSLH